MLTLAAARLSGRTRLASCRRVSAAWPSLTTRSCGRVTGVASKSGSLSYEVIDALNALGLGQSSVCCLGGDPVIATRFAEIMRRFEADPDTHGVVLLGEVGGGDEIEAA